jgi:hypothetical protein
VTKKSVNRNDAASASASDEVSGDPRAALRKLSHDVKNALHGISVNLEVARSRAARGGVDPDALVPFLESAAQQLEVAVRLHKEFATLAVESAGS